MTEFLCLILGVWMVNKLPGRSTKVFEYDIFGHKVSLGVENIQRF